MPSTQKRWQLSRCAIRCFCSDMHTYQPASSLAVAGVELTRWCQGNAWFLMLLSLLAGHFSLHLLLCTLDEPAVAETW
jgi:hypothetical protein